LFFNVFWASDHNNIQSGLPAIHGDARKVLTLAYILGQKTALEPLACLCVFSQTDNMLWIYEHFS
jgi:hypothetical protein